MNKRQIGSYYENLAASFLENQGLRIIEKNFRCRFGEIDLIAKDKNYLVFAEVKWRNSGFSGTAKEAVTYEKQRTISKVAKYYLFQKKISFDSFLRFDVIAIDQEEISWQKDAFFYTE